MYVPFPLDQVELNAPIPVNIWDPHGQLLLRRGEVIRTEQQLGWLRLHGAVLKEDDYRTWTYRYNEAIERMVRDNASLESIAEAKRPTGVALEKANDAEPPLTEVWPDLHDRLTTLLHQNVHAQDFVTRFLTVERRLMAALRYRVDDSLFILVQMLFNRGISYSASHALLTAVLCRLVAEAQQWPEDRQHSLMRAALTMNIGMARLHDELARQDTAVTPLQRQQIQDHPRLGHALLRQLGVQDPLWLAWVLDHHGPDATPGTPPSEPLQLLRIADVFVARISPRANRAGLSTQQAARDAYLGKDGQPNPLGAAFVKTLGLYLPGSYVRLATDEVAVVVRRGRRANEPVTFALLGKDGMPYGEPKLRETGDRGHEIKATVPPEQVKVLLPVSKLLTRA